MMKRTRRDAMRRRAVALVCAAVFTVSAATASADDAEMAKSAGVGLGSAVATVLYAPAKTFYAFGGILVGGLAYAFSGGDADVARVVLEPSVLGDYVITTQHLEGERPIQFFGQQKTVDATYENAYRVEETDVAAAPEGW